ncbi:MAG TPA: glycosyltransferase family 39 protein [Candidatus Limnocylindrales bacterium]|nr:glycosyltransferase family 39 protein [Candidatus Limnocylindrales bacterium]
MPAARAVGLLVALAFVLRVAANLWLTIPTPVLHADALWYHLTAANLAAGYGYIHHFTGKPTAAWPPGYPFLLSVLYRTLSPDPAWGFALNAVAGTITCWLTGLIARSLFSTRAQVVATALIAVAPSQILFSSLLLTETIFTTMMTALVLGAIVLLDPSRQRSPVLWILWGAAVGLAGLLRAEAVLLLFAPVLVLLTQRMRRTAAIAVLGCAVAGAVACQTPWLVRNARVFGRIVPASTSFGRTLLIGHNPVADGGMNLYSPDPAADQRDLIAGGPERELAVDNRLRDAGVRFALENPRAELGLVFRRLYRMYHGDRVWNEWYAEPSASAGGSAPHPPIGEAAMEMLGRASNLFYWLLLLAAAPAAMGLVSTDRSSQNGPRSGYWLVLSVLVLWSAFYGVVLYGSERFHFALIPLACVLASATISAGVERMRSDGLR